MPVWERHWLFLLQPTLLRTSTSICILSAHSSHDTTVIENSDEHNTTGRQIHTTLPTQQQRSARVQTTNNGGPAVRNCILRISNRTLSSSKLSSAMTQTSPTQVHSGSPPRRPKGESTLFIVRATSRDRETSVATSVLFPEMLRWLILPIAMRIY